MLLSGCSNIPAKPINTLPTPWFPSCPTICDAARQDAPDSVYKDWVRSVNVMLKLRAQQDKKDREDFGNCVCKVLYQTKIK